MDRVLGIIRSKLPNVEPIEMLVILLAILIGLFVIAPRLLGRDTRLQQALALMRQYEGHIGVAVAVLGVILFAVLVFNNGWWLLYPLSITAAAMISAILGLLLAYPLISDRVFSRNEDAKAKAKAFRARWETRQIMLAWTLVFLGVSALILYAVR